METILNSVKSYFMDPDIQSEKKLQIFSDLDAATVQVLHQSLQSHNYRYHNMFQVGNLQQIHQL
jgi:hypothetical protein